MGCHENCWKKRVCRQLFSSLRADTSQRQLWEGLALAHSQTGFTMNVPSVRTLGLQLVLLLWDIGADLMGQLGVLH